MFQDILSYKLSKINHVKIVYLHYYYCTLELIGQEFIHFRNASTYVSKQSPMTIHYKRYLKKSITILLKIILLTIFLEDSIGLPY